MRHPGGEVAHSRELFLAPHFPFKAAYFHLGPALPLAGFPRTLGVIQGQKAGQPHKQGHCREHGDIVPVLAARNFKGRDIQAKKYDGRGIPPHGVGHSGRKLAVHGKNPASFQVHDAPARQHAGVQPAHARLVHLLVLNPQDLAQAGAVAVRHYGSIGHGHRNKDRVLPS